MGVNIFGPHGPGINESTVRPNDTSSGNAEDTWFAPCVDSNPATGTKVPARWLNKVLANFRRAVRGLGVPEAELDDDMLLKCFQKVDRAIRNIGGAVGLYKQRAGDGVHEFYSLEGLGGIQVTLDGANNKVKVDGTNIATGGKGLESVGDGMAVYKGANATHHQFRSVEGVNGIAASLNGEKVRLDGAALQPPGAQSVGAGVPVYKGRASNTDSFRSVRGINGIATTVSVDTNEVVVDGAGLLGRVCVTPTTLVIAGGSWSVATFDLPAVNGLWEIATILDLNGGSNGDERYNFAFEISNDGGSSWAGIQSGQSTWQQNDGGADVRFSSSRRDTLQVARRRMPSIDQVNALMVGFNGAESAISQYTNGPVVTGNTRKVRLRVAPVAGGGATAQIIGCCLHTLTTAA